MSNPEPPQPMPGPMRVSVVDFDMPLGSMILMLLKWAIAAVPAMLVLTVVGAIVGMVMATLLTGAASFTSVMPRGTAPAAEPTKPSTPTLVVTVRQTRDGWSITNDSSLAGQNCSLSIAGHAANIPELSREKPVIVASSALGGGGIPEGARITERDILVFCAAPEARQARVYLLQ